MQKHRQQQPACNARWGGEQLVMKIQDSERRQWKTHHYKNNNCLLTMYLTKDEIPMIRVDADFTVVGSPAI